MTFTRNTKLHQPEVLKRIVELRDIEKVPEKDAIKKIKEEFGLKTFSNTAYQGLYKEALATTITYDKKANRAFEKFADELEKMYAKSIKVLSRLVDALDKIQDEFEAEDTEQVNTYLKFIRLTPEIKATTEQILKMIQYHEEQQDRIRVEQKRLSLQTPDIVELINDYLPQLQKEGKIKILKEF